MNHTFSNVNGHTLSMAIFLAHNDYDGDSPDDKTISVTNLLKSTRQVVLTKRLSGDLVSDISNFIASRMGQAWHLAIEQALTSDKLEETLIKLGYPSKVAKLVVVNPTKEYLKDNPDALPIYTENRIEKVVNGWTISGKYDQVMMGVLEDNKQTKTFSYGNEEKIEDYSLQGSMYRYLNPDIITEDYMRINFNFPNWEKYMSKKAGYPHSQLMSQVIKLKSPEFIEQFIISKTNEINKYIDADEEVLPFCSPRELWQKPSVYKYFANPNNKTATKNFDNAFDANTYQREKGKGIVVEQLGEVVACKYCACFNLCTQKDQYINNGLLKLE